MKWRRSCETLTLDLSCIYRDRATCLTARPWHDEVSVARKECLKAVGWLRLLPQTSYFYITHCKELFFVVAENIPLSCTAESSPIFFFIYSISSHPSIIITQAARMRSDADVCPPDESLHYRLVWAHRCGFKGTCLNNLTLLQTSGWWRQFGPWEITLHCMVLR